MMNSFKRHDIEHIESLISDLRVLCFNFLDDDTRCSIDGFDAYNAVCDTLEYLESRLKELHNDGN